MAKYTLIASRDPFDSTEASHYCDVAADLKKAGNDVTVFLVQNAVFGARTSAASARYSALAKQGVSVLADDFSLRERSIAPNALAEGVSAAPLDTVVDHLAEGRKVVWH